MDFKNVIDKNPMILVDDALAIISSATIIQHGIVFPDTLHDATERIKRHAYDLILNTPSITKVYKDVHHNTLDAIEIEEMGFCSSSTLVDLKQLLFAYNADRKANGVPIIFISRWTNATVNIKPDVATCSSSIVDLVSAITRFTNDAVTREEALKSEIFDQMFNEYTAALQDKDIVNILSDIKKAVREKIEYKMAAGNIGKITDKKIEATIQLAEKCHDVSVSTNDKPDLIQYLRKSKLSRADREHVVDTFIAVKSQ